MGNILQGLGIGSGGQQPDMLAQYRPSLAGPGGFSGPMTSPPINGMMPPGEGPPALAAPEDVVTGWAPKKPTILGAIADAYLMSKGGKPMFSMMRNQEDMRRAMTGFTNDPKEAVRRVGMIPGMQEKAWEMFNQQIDNERATGTLERQNRALDMRNDGYIFSMTAGMMGAAEPETWGKMRELAIARAKARNVDVEHLIPKEYDPDTIEYMRYGEVKPKDQMRLEQQDRTQKWREHYQGERLEQIDEAEAGRNERAEVSEAGKNARSNKPNTQRGPNPKSLAGRAFRGPNGTLVEYNKDGTGIKATHKSGKVFYYKLGIDGKPVKVGEE
jgi:hypothetical protein